MLLLLVPNRKSLSTLLRLRVLVAGYPQPDHADSSSVTKHFSLLDRVQREWNVQSSLAGSFDVSWYVSKVHMNVKYDRW